MAPVADIHICDVKTTLNGTKVANIKADDDDLIYLLDEFMSIPFNPSSFVESDSTHKNLLITMSDAIHKEFARLDACLIIYIAEHSERILKKRQSIEQVRANYVSCIRTSKDYPPTIKTKVELGGGQYGVVCWDSDGERVDLPESWRDFEIKPNIVVSNLWMFGGKFGPVLRLTDALLRPNEGNA